MTPEKFCLQLLKNFPFEPTPSQGLWFRSISEFVILNHPKSVFLLKGYAGTGKTTLIGSLVKQLKNTGYKAVLLAPTGRAAKVMSIYSDYPSFTIHKQIYYPKTENSGNTTFQLKSNKHSKTIFIVDEASMIGDQPKNGNLFENMSLLSDLIQYVTAGNMCKLIFVGDPAQLPPVNNSLSPALDSKRLEHYYFKKVFEVELDDVTRQKNDSGILYNANQLRLQIQSEINDQYRFDIQNLKDIKSTTDGFFDVFEALETSFDQSGIDQTAFIVRSNKRANLINKHIRKRILGLDDELCVGDQLMIVKNNYYWLDVYSKAGFIANGDIIEVLSITSRKNIYDFSFAEVKVKLIDYPNEPPFKTVLLLNTLNSETPSLSFDDGNRLYQNITEDYKYEKSKYKRFIKVKKNPFLNALQVKYSYALTCHKSQGGQWENIFIEKPFMPDGINRDYLRWLYTAITRATKKLFLIGFQEEDFI